jgi:hypothetical protein
MPINVLAEVLAETAGVQADVGSVQDQLRVLERLLVLEQGIVHCPEMLLTLRRRGFCGFSGVAGVRVLRSRKVAIYKPEPVAEPLANVFDLRVGHATERALEIAVLHQRDGCVG